ncbi:MAG: beta-ketoacyl synthase N-terminal-like domain-containing protein, partial [Xanthobacteraceae bacterium]
MASVPTRDKAGRPVIAVTGIGVVTSLGIGKDDNWSKLSAGVSGVRRISRFPVDGLRTTIAGTVDAAYSDYMPPADLTTRIAFLAAEEAVAQSRIGSKNHFPGPLFIAPPPLELEWHYREVLDEAAATAGDANYPDLVRAARQPQFSTVFSSAKGSTVAERLADHFGTEGSPVSLNTACASGATGIQ